MENHFLGRTGVVAKDDVEIEEIRRELGEGKYKSSHPCTPTAFRRLDLMRIFERPTNSTKFSSLNVNVVVLLGQ